MDKILKVLQTDTVSLKSLERYNRVRVEWSKVLTPIEYMLLDKILFQSNLIKANNGNGYYFHVRQLAKELNKDCGYLSRILKHWSFIHKQGTNRNMCITLNYAEFLKWIDTKLRDCCAGSTVTVVQEQQYCCAGATLTVAPGQPISNREEVVEERRSKEVPVLSTEKIEIPSTKPRVEVGVSYEELKRRIEAYLCC